MARHAGQALNFKNSFSGNATLSPSSSCRFINANQRRQKGKVDTSGPQQCAQFCFAHG